MPGPRGSTPQGRIARLVTLAAAVGSGLAVGAVTGFVLGARWTADVLVPGGNGAPGPEVIPAAAIGILAAGLGAVVGAAALGALAGVLLSHLDRLRHGSTPGKP